MGEGEGTLMWSARCILLLLRSLSMNIRRSRTRSVTERFPFSRWSEGRWLNGRRKSSVVKVTPTLARGRRCLPVRPQRSRSCVCAKCKCSLLVYLTGLFEGLETTTSAVKTGSNRSQPRLLRHHHDNHHRRCAVSNGGIMKKTEPTIAYIFNLKRLDCNFDQ